MKKNYSLIVIGGGAAGFFAALKSAEKLPRGSVLILEQTQKVLSKVKISGGGRCNVTHACFDPKNLVQNYPRGSKELLGPFHHFQPKDLITWFNERGVALKTEEDGRLFPITDDSQTIIDCFLDEAEKLGIEICRGAKVAQLNKENDQFQVVLKSEEILHAPQVMLATGSSSTAMELAISLGHSVVSLVPSLFTFNVPDSPLLPLSGISVEDTAVALPSLKKEYRGPILLTHWGFSGPAVLKLSAWAARELHDLSYNAPLQIDWLPQLSFELVKEEIFERGRTHPKKCLENDFFLPLPKNLYLNFLSTLQIPPKIGWSELSLKLRLALVQKLKKDLYQISGKTPYKQEFVTAGGIQLSEVDFKSMESKLVKGLYFGGEVLNIDGITGGFNFQAAWSAGWIAGKAIGSR